MRMKNPPHPGLLVRHDYFEPLGLSVAEGAKELGVTRQAMLKKRLPTPFISPKLPLNRHPFTQGAH